MRSGPRLCPQDQPQRAPDRKTVKILQSARVNMECAGRAQRRRRFGLAPWKVLGARIVSSGQPKRGRRCALAPHSIVRALLIRPQDRTQTAEPIPSPLPRREGRGQGEVWVKRSRFWPVMAGFPLTPALSHPMGEGERWTVVRGPLTAGPIVTKNRTGQMPSFA